jgi:hypothetical protein
MGVERPARDFYRGAMSLSPQPDWVNWLAQDADGALWAMKPNPTNRITAV